MANQEREPRAYELMTVFIPDISEEDTQAQIEKVSTYISNAGGTVNESLTDSPWGRRRLAFTIRFNGTDYRDGFYTVYHFDSAPSNLTELERDLKLDTSVMRYLLVHDDPKAGEKPREGEDETAEGGEPTEPTTAPAEQASQAPAASTEQAEPAAVQAPERAEEQAQPTETAPANAESTPEAAVATGAVTSDGGETPPAAETATGDAEAESTSEPETAETDTDETTDKE